MNIEAEGSSPDKITHVKKRAFLAAFSRCASISRAAKRAKVDRRTHYDWKRDDPEYVKAFAAAEIEAGDAVVDALAEEGLERRNVTALIFLAKGLKPEKFRERQDISHSGEVTVVKRVLGVPDDAI